MIKFNVTTRYVSGKPIKRWVSDPPGYHITPTLGLGYRLFNESRQMGRYPTLAEAMSAATEHEEQKHETSEIDRLPSP